MNNNIEFNKKEYKDYKPKTPIAEGRRTFNNENMKFNIEENNNDPLENKFLNINRTNKNDKDLRLVWILIIFNIKPWGIKTPLDKIMKMKNKMI